MDYAENICQAVDTIVQKRLAELKFDITDIYTILDNTDKAKGIYKVGKDNIAFNAFGNLSYNIGDEVYVTIPQGNWDQTKFIIGPAYQSNFVITDITVDIPTLYSDNRIFCDAQGPIETYNFNVLCLELEMKANPDQGFIEANWETEKTGPHFKTLCTFGNNGITYSKQKHYLTVKGNDQIKNIAFQLMDNTEIKNIKLYLTNRTSYSLMEEIQELKETLLLYKLNVIGGEDNG